MLQTIGRANLTAEKGVSLVYERIRRPEEFHWGDWISRVEDQIRAGLVEMEAAAPETGWHSGSETPMGDDITVVIAYEFVAAQHPQLTGDTFPRLERLSAASGQIPAFAKTRLTT
jgi:glutathione S-transferase